MDNTGTGRGNAILRWPANFNADPFKPRPIIVFASSRNVAVTTLESTWGFGSGSVTPGVSTLATDADALVLLVQGKTGSHGANAWNDNLCCCWEPGDGAAPADASYIDDLVVNRLPAAGWKIDPKARFLAGESAGEGLGNRMACDFASDWAGIIGFSGTASQTVEGGDTACNPSDHVNFAHIHGTADVSQEPWTGSGSLNFGMPNHCFSAFDGSSSPTTTQQKTFNSCGGTLDVITTGWADLDTAHPGNNTDLLRWSGCPSGGSVELWRMNSTDHSLTPNTTPWRAKFVDWVTNHHKP